MGDTRAGSLPASDFSNNPISGSNPRGSSDNEARQAGQGSSQSTYPHVHPQQQHPSQSRQDPFNMTNLGGMLPDMSYQNYSNLPQRHLSGHSPSAHLYQMQSVPQFTGSQVPQVLPSQMTNAPYNVPYQGQFQGIYPPGNTPAAQHLQSGSQFYQGQGFIGQPQQGGSQFYIPANQYPPQNQMYAGGSPVTQYGMRSNFPGESRLAAQQRGSEYLGAGSSSGAPGRSSSATSSTGQSSVVRGPPRKPRQSGHAVWIGNLPPQTDLMSLVLHVCKEAPGLESLFLISKSNCAFANFKDEATCMAGQAKIHDSRFQTVRLVSRLRRSSVGTAAGLAAPTGPAALTPPNPPVARSPSPVDNVASREGSTEKVDGQLMIDGVDEISLLKDKFFIVKSLTVEDLELSVRNGIWATQSHNEEALNKAYETADNVYLIFSANKSGEYFGYAKMVSPINDDPAAAIEFAPKAQLVEDPELPKAIPTPATEFAPKGRIIDDSARGTIFWEIERDEIEEEDEDENENENETRSNRSDDDTSSKAWGKPFKIEWISTMRLPFYRTRGLRNPWNSNREVKIARDGTELETAIGRRLLGLFHRLPSPVAPQTQGIPLLSMDGYPPMRPYS